MKRTLAVLGMTILICVVLPGSANSQQAIVLKGGKLLTVSHGTIENGVLVIENGKITAVGSVAEVKIPANARVQDVSGMTVYPGLIDSESYLGLAEVSFYSHGACGAIAASLFGRAALCAGVGGL